MAAEEIMGCRYAEGFAKLTNQALAQLRQSDVGSLLDGEQQDIVRRLDPPRAPVTPAWLGAVLTPK